ncbi:MAG: ATP-binding protein [Planctomycetota bacterium]
MDEADAMLESLREALALSPDNAVLRRQVATMLMSRGRLDEAEALLRDGVRRPDADASMQLLLARCFVAQGKTSEALVLAEALAERGGSNLEPRQRVELARVLLRGGNTDVAARAYRRAVDDDPEAADPALAKDLGVDAFTEAEADDGDDSDDDVDELGRIRQRHESAATSPVEMEKPDINFDHVGGMEALKEEIRIKIIAPLENAELFKAYGKATGGGILMYGPPGCGKTHLARATAGQIDAGFISVGIHDVLDMFIGQSEQKLHALFAYARAHTPCVLFFDEVDALGAKRTDMRGSAGRQVINQFLAELDGVKDSNDGLLVLAATNAPWSLDSAFRRPGRFDRVLFVPPPDSVSCAAILRVLLEGKPQQDIDHAAVAKKCARFSGADLKAVVDLAVEAKLREAMKTGTPTPITTKDLLKAAKTVKPSTLEWFATAKNHALYANEAGVYDDVVDYLKRK